MAESDAERAERLRKFAEKHNENVKNREGEGKGEQAHRDNLDKKDSQS